MHIVSKSDNTPWIWNAVIGECEAKLEGYSDYIFSVVFSSDGMYIVSASKDCTARIWDTTTGICKAELRGHLDHVYSAVFSFDDVHVVSASKDCSARIWNATTGECEVELKRHSFSVKSANNKDKKPIAPPLVEKVLTRTPSWYQSRFRLP